MMKELFLFCVSLFDSFASNSFVCVKGALLSIPLRSDDVMSCSTSKQNRIEVN